MTLYRILLGIDGAALGIALFFFLWGVSDGTVSSFNILSWMAMLGVLAGIVGGGVALQRGGRPAAAKGLLSLLAVPAALAGLLILALILINPRWN
ncbi:hypothetical protein [Falsiroseomonas oryzae]|uniref:hypothetical protein n=1 Tax=Falsiroseomonas oryzae TaxID=2766473 RepID=UPI0022EA9082|nr:hypothetical protein [Roseomonas sp. MO-31]